MVHKSTILSHRIVLCDVADRENGCGNYRTYSVCEIMHLIAELITTRVKTLSLVAITVEKIS